MKPGWTTEAIGDVCLVTMGQAPPGTSYNDAGRGHPLLAGAGDFKAGRASAKKFTSEASKVSQVGDIVVGIRATIGEKVRADRAYCLGRGVAGLRPLEERLNADYLWHWLTYAKVLLASKGRGATFLQVNRSDITSLEVPLPPLEEQRRIASILDRAAALVLSQERVLDALTTLREAIVERALSASASSVAGLSELAEIRIGPFGSLLHREDYVTGGVPLVNPMHIVGGRVVADGEYSITDAKADELARYRLRVGDVVMGRRGEMGRCALVTESEAGYICGTGSLIVRPRSERALASFLVRALSTRGTVRALEARALGATLPNLNTKIMEQLHVPNLPISKQAELEVETRMVELQLRRGQSRLNMLGRLHESLQARAFSGRL